MTEPRNTTQKLNPTDDTVGDGSVAHQIVSRSAFFSGPLPPPELLAAYEGVQHGLAERIVAMAEKEQSFGHEITRAALEAENSEHKRGQTYALAVSMAAFITSFGLACIGAIWPSAVVGGATVVGLVTAFVLGRKSSGNRPAPDQDEEKPSAGPPARRKK